MKLYKYFFYKLFCLWLRKKDEVENAHINAVISMAFLTGINLISIPLILMASFGKDVISIPQLPSNWILFLVVIIYGVIHYFLLAYKKKYLEIVEEYKNENKEKNKMGTFFIWLYIVISLGIPLFILFFTTPK